MHGQWSSYLKGYTYSFIHFIGLRRMRRFLAIFRSVFHFSLFYTLSFHPSPPTSLPLSLTSSCHLFLGLPLPCCFQIHIYEGHSEINASYFIMLAHDIRGRCWWYGSRGWTFPPIFRQILLPCDRWRQRGSLTKRRLTWKGVWSKGV